MLIGGVINFGVQSTATLDMAVDLFPQDAPATARKIKTVVIFDYEGELHE